MNPGPIDPTAPDYYPRYGLADPTGVTECSNALNHALQQSRWTGRPVFLRPGKYRVAHTLHVGGASLLGYQRASFWPTAPWADDEDSRKRTRIVVSPPDPGQTNADFLDPPYRSLPPHAVPVPDGEDLFRDGVIVAGPADSGLATRLEGFDVICEQREYDQGDPARSITYRNNHRGWFRAQQGIHIAASNASIVRDVRVFGAGLVCWHIDDSQVCHFHRCDALYAPGDGWWLANANGTVLDRTMVRYCAGPHPIHVHTGVIEPYTLRSGVAPATSGCEIRYMNIEACDGAHPNQCACLIEGVRANVRILGGWMENNSGDGFVLKRARFAQISGVTMKGGQNQAGANKQPLTSHLDEAAFRITQQTPATAHGIKIEGCSVETRGSGQVGVPPLVGWARIEIEDAALAALLSTPTLESEYNAHHLRTHLLDQRKRTVTIEQHGLPPEPHTWVHSITNRQHSDLWRYPHGLHILWYDPADTAIPNDHLINTDP